MNETNDLLAQALAKAADAICEAAVLQEEIDGAGAAAGFEDAATSAVKLAYASYTTGLEDRPSMRVSVEID